MNEHQINERLIPATRWRSYPVLKNRLRGHWVLWRDQRWDYDKQESVEKFRVDIIAGTTGGKVRGVRTTNGTRLGLGEAWVLPETVPIGVFWPKHDWGGYRGLSKAGLIEVLGQALESDE